MSKMNVNSLSVRMALLATMILHSLSVSSQSPSSTISIKGDTATLYLSTRNAVSPEGFRYSTYGERIQYSLRDQGLFPVMKNEPENLKNTFSYCILLDDFQFYYQNYRTGRLPKSEFMAMVPRYKWELSDTIRLSSIPIRCYISIMGGVDSAGTLFYIVDKNGNNDYSDDVLFPLVRGSSDQDNIIESSLAVEVDVFKDNKITKIERMIFPVLSSSNKISLMYPEFNYINIYLDSADLMLISTDNGIYLQDNLPNFAPLNSARKILVGQVLVIKNSQYRVKEISSYGRVVKLVGPGVKALKTSKSANDSPNRTSSLVTAGKDLKLVSNQVGFYAPPIDGTNILNNKLIKLESLKGKYVFVDFWGTSCGPCIAEFPFLKEAYDKFNRDKLEIIGVVDERSAGEALSIMTSKNVTWPTIKTTSATGRIKGYNITAYPTTYLIDPEGKIIAMNLRGRELSEKMTKLLSK